MGFRYTHSDYLLIDWQNDDLPIFGHIQYIAVVNEHVLFGVCTYHAYGIDRHYHSFAISNTGEVSVCLLSDLKDRQTFRGHLLNNGFLYVTFHSHIEKT